MLKENAQLTAQTFAKKALEEKLLVVGAGEKVIRMLPPLTIKKREVNQLLKRLEKTLKNFD